MAPIHDDLVNVLSTSLQLELTLQVHLITSVVLTQKEEKKCGFYLAASCLHNPLLPCHPLAIYIALGYFYEYDSVVALNIGP